GVVHLEHSARMPVLPRERAPRQTGHHDIECVFRVTTMRRRIGQQRDDLEEARERIRESVREYQRQGPRTTSALVDEVNVRSVDLRHVVTEAIEILLFRAPVVLRLPMTEQLAQIVRARA